MQTYPYHSCIIMTEKNLMDYIRVFQLINVLKTFLFFSAAALVVFNYLRASRASLRA